MRQAEWNNITWGTSGNQMAHLKSFKISQKLKTEEQENQSTGNKTIVKSLEPEVLNISYSASFAIGIDPRGEFEMLKKCAGMQDVFILGGQRISKTNFLLEEILLLNIYSSRLPSIARAKVTSSAYSKSAPTGKPNAILEILIPKGLISLVKYRLVASPSTDRDNASITS